MTVRLNFIIFAMESAGVNSGLIFVLQIHLKYQIILSFKRFILYQKKWNQ